MVVHEMDTDGSASEAASSPLKMQEHSPVKLLPIQKPKKKSPPKLSSEDPKKKTTKEMIQEALSHLGELEKRKGVSIHAIKKYLETNFNFDAEKNKFLLKKALKAEIEAGKIVQTKGTGVTGSFKLVKTKEKKKTTKKEKNPEDASDKLPVKKKLKTGDVEKPKKKKPKSIEKKTEATKKEKKKSTEKSSESKKKSSVKTVESKKELKVNKTETEPPKKKTKDVNKSQKSVKVVENNNNTPKKKKNMKKVDNLLTPAQKKLLMKRRSSGTIIKAPKMKPKAK